MAHNFGLLCLSSGLLQEILAYSSGLPGFPGGSKSIAIGLNWYQVCWMSSPAGWRSAGRLRAFWIYAGFQKIRGPDIDPNILRPSISIGTPKTGHLNVGNSQTVANGEQKW